MASLALVWGPREKETDPDIRGGRGAQHESLLRPRASREAFAHSGPLLNVSFSSLLTNLGSISLAWREVGSAVSPVV